ncbi:MAG TPA: hypothetical protein VM784_05755 [Actinomycetota bacterium]|jgi:hypothetical protein|nr:hypothetical protein [Actinomycetota bacterium]
MTWLVNKSEEICRVCLEHDGREKLARDLDAVSASDEDIAKAYAAGFQPHLQVAAEAACLRGLRSARSVPQ